MKDKYKIIVTKEQLNVIFIRVLLAAELQPKDMIGKLMVSHLIAIHKKLLLKWTFPSAKNSISLTTPEAIAFWISFHHFKFSDPYVFATFNPILNDIHQKFI